jgi:hypothetical protein
MNELTLKLGRHYSNSADSVKYGRIQFYWFRHFATINSTTNSGYFTVFFIGSVEGDTPKQPILRKRMF